MGPVLAILQAIGTFLATHIVAGNLFLAIGQLVGAHGFLAWAIGATIVTVGLTLVSALFIHRPNSPSIEASKVNVKITEPPRWLCAGVARQGGGVLFGEFDDSGNFWFLTVHSDSILTNTLTYYFDDIPITVDGSGNVTTDDFCLTPKKDVYVSGTKVTYFQIWTTTYSETDPTPPAITALETAFPTKWTSNHKLVGTTYSVVKINALDIQNRYKIYKWRGPFGLGEPAVSIVGEWSHAYDPRDMSQTNGTPSTYTFTKNPVLMWAWFRTHRYGRNKDRSSINWAMVAAQADLCDQTVTGISGDHVRYECGTAIPETTERAVAEQEILMSMDAQLVFDDTGTCWPRVGYYTAPTLMLSRNRDVVAMESVEAQNGESETQGVIVRYLDPEANYSAQPSAAWYNPLYYIDGEAATFLTVDILTCQDHNQAMRLAKGIGMRSQPAHKIVPTMGLRGLKARQERIFNLTYDNTFAGDYEIATTVDVDPVGILCGFGAVPIDPDRWTLLTGEERAKPVVDNSQQSDVPTLPTGVALVYNNGRIEITFDPPGRTDVTYQFQYILTADISTGNWLDATVQMLTNFAYTGLVSQGVQYSVQYRTFFGSGRVTDWSTPATITIGLSIDPASLLAAVGAAGSADVSWRNPNNVNFGYTDVRRGTTTTYAASTIVGAALVGGLGQVQHDTDTVVAGSYYYWVVSHATDGTAATPTGPVSATVT